MFLFLHPPGGDKQQAEQMKEGDNEESSEVTNKSWTFDHIDGRIFVCALVLQLWFMHIPYVKLIISNYTHNSEMCTMSP